MESLLAWGLLLLGAAFIVMVVDLFMPTAGVLAVVAGLLAVAGVVCLFRHDTSAGITGALAVLVLAPAMVLFGLRIWPDTPIGRRIIGIPSDEEQERLAAERAAEEKRRRELIGTTAMVVVDLRPVGMVEIAGKRFDAKSETFFVPAGAQVKVTGIEGNELRVRQQA